MITLSKYTTQFDYTGKDEQVLVPAGLYEIECYGASSSKLASYTKGQVQLFQLSLLRLQVGGIASGLTGGWPNGQSVSATNKVNPVASGGGSLIYLPDNSILIGAKGGDGNSGIRLASGYHYVQYTHNQNHQVNTVDANGNYITSGECNVSDNVYTFTASRNEECVFTVSNITRTSGTYNNSFYLSVNGYSLYGEGTIRFTAVAGRSYTIYVSMTNTRYFYLYMKHPYEQYESYSYDVTVAGGTGGQGNIFNLTPIVFWHSKMINQDIYSGNGKIIIKFLDSLRLNSNLYKNIDESVSSFLMFLE